METPPAPEAPKTPWGFLWISAAAVLGLIVVLPKSRNGEDLAMGLGWLEIFFLIALWLTYFLPRIRRSQLGCLVQILLGVAVVTLGVVGSVLLVLFACVGTSGLL